MEITVMIPYIDGEYDPDVTLIVAPGHLTDAEVEQYLLGLEISVPYEDAFPGVFVEDGFACFVDKKRNVSPLEYRIKHAKLGDPLRGK